jgi:hypothetical protein
LESYTGRQSLKYIYIYLDIIGEISIISVKGKRGGSKTSGSWWREEGTRGGVTLLVTPDVTRAADVAVPVGDTFFSPPEKTREGKHPNEPPGTDKIGKTVV